MKRIRSGRGDSAGAGSPHGRRTGPAKTPALKASSAGKAGLRGAKSGVQRASLERKPGLLEYGGDTRSSARDAGSGRESSAGGTALSAAVRLVKVEPEREGQRIDNFLLGQLKGVPRSLVYRLLRTGQVRVDGGRCKAEQKLLAGQTVRIPPVKVASAGAPVQAPRNLLASLEDCVRFENDSLLVIDKPSGLASHGGSGVGFGVIEALRQSRHGESLELVHRLDRDTSGLLVVAKRRSTLLQLQAAMREGDGDKRYLALLDGVVQRQRVDVNAPLRKQVLSGGERMVRVSPEGKPSLSHFRVLERFSDCTLVEARIDTGRTHQIRVHAAHLGHPVLGDPKYGNEARNQQLRQLGLQRLFLHAAELRMPRADAGQWHWQAALPAALEAVLEKLRARAEGKAERGSS